MNVSAQPGSVRIGPYELIEQIGEGGMGVVHLARGENGRRVALKVMRPQVVSDHDSRRRFAREIASLRSVRSPHVAEILDADSDCPTPYVVTRYVPGHSLYELVRLDGPAPREDLVHLALRLLDALADVHRAGVLHRDLKPTNVVMEGRNPILIDFGVARLANDVAVTTTGFMIGTPGYLAPEVLFGDPATTATDLHGWAATVAYAGTGRSPYGSGHPMAVLDRTRRGDVQVAGLPDDVRSVVQAALALEPHHRPTLAEARQLLAAPGLSLQPPTQRLSAFVRPDVTLISPAPPEPVTRQLTSVAPVPLDDRGLPDHARPAQGLPPAQPPPGSVEEVYLRTLGQRAEWPERLRRVGVVLAAWCVAIATVGYAPYVAVGTMAIMVWFVGGAHRSSRALEWRRQLRGERWHDGPRVALGFPLALVTAFPAALGLTLFAAVVASGFSLSALLVGAEARPSLMGGGAAFAFVMWNGPGSGALRPVQRAVLSLSRDARLWAATVCLLLAGAALAGLQSEVVWSPLEDGPVDSLREAIGR